MISDLKFDIKILTYLTQKIKTSYKYPKVKKVMNDLIDTSIKNFKLLVKNIDDTIAEFTGYLDLLKNGNQLMRDNNTSRLYSYGPAYSTILKMIYNINDKIDKIQYEQYMTFFASFTDIYFLRRFLDKDYITNAIVYTGAFHSNTYVDVLVKNFDFRVTHIANSDVKNMAKLTAEIKKRQFMEVQELILPKYLEQCSDMNGFPKEFE